LPRAAGDTSDVDAATSTAKATARGRRDARQAPTAIYGTIISASVLAAAGDDDTALSIGLGVFFTLLVYWLAERWSELIGEHLSGEPFDWAHARRVFVRGWPLVQASYGPLFVLLVARLLGASVELAVELALLWTILTLVGLGILAGYRARLSTVGVIGSAVFNGLLGLLLIFLKSLLH
jgi:hypothetical protein